MADAPKAEHLQPNPDDYAGFISRKLFLWLDPTIRLGSVRPLKMADMHDVSVRDSVEACSDRFKTSWNKELEKEKPSLWKAFWSAWGWEFMQSGIPKLLSDLSMLTTPFLLFLFILWMAGYSIPLQYCFVFDICLPIPVPDSLREFSESNYYGLALACTFFAFVFITNWLQAIYQIGAVRVALQVRNALVYVIYEKSLRLSEKARLKVTSGMMANTVSTDCQMTLLFFFTMFHFLWSGPIVVVLAAILMLVVVGPATFCALLVIPIIMPVTFWASRKMQKKQAALMIFKDKRVKLLQEMLQGIKMIKLYAWEDAFIEKMEISRDKEVQQAYTINKYRSIMVWLMQISPTLLAMVLFALAGVFSPALPISAATMFTALSLINILFLPVAMIPMVLGLLFQAMVSFNRIRSILLAEEVPSKPIDAKASGTVDIVEADFRWPVIDRELEALAAEAKKAAPAQSGGVEGPAAGIEAAPPLTLQSIDLSVQSGELIAVVGSVASGKSSLISAILGDLPRLSGQTVVQGSVAYCAQNAWVKNDTVRDNILWGEVYNHQQYSETIEACALLADFEILASGDKTEIGEQGINVSGGQRQRISIARAVYSDSDIYLFDDPLSALDAHVGRHIFDQVLLGLLKNKTRIFVTHQVQLLPECDRVVVMENGRIAAVGRYDELLEAGVDMGGIASKQRDESDSPKEKSEEEAGKKKAKKQVQLAPGDEKDGKGKGKSKGKSATIARWRSQGGPNIENKALIIKKEGQMSGKIDNQAFIEYFSTIPRWLLIVTIGFFIFVAFNRMITNAWLALWTSNLVPCVANDSVAIADLINPAKWSAITANLFYVDLSQGQVSCYLVQLGFFVPGLIALTVTYVITSFIMWMISAYDGAQASKKLHLKLVRSIFAAPMSFFEATPVGRIVNRSAGDLAMVDTQLPFFAAMFFQFFLLVAILLIAIIIGAPFFIFVAVPLCFGYYQLQDYYRKSNRELKRLEMISRSPIISHLTESQNGVATVRAYGAEGRFNQQMRQKINYNTRAYFVMMCAQGWIKIRMGTLGAIGVAAIAFIAVAFVFLFGRTFLPVSVFGLCLAFAIQITFLFDPLIRFGTEAEAFFACVQRIVEYSSGLDAEAPRITDTTPPPHWPTQGAIDFTNLSMQYRADLDPVLKDISFSVAPGEKIGIVGRTGAGKSSLLVALFRLVEASTGSITVDGIRIQDLGLSDLRSRLAIIPQEPILYSGTLRYNLDPFDQHSDEELWLVLEQAGMKETVMQMPDQLLAAVAEGGDNFSVGERSLLSLSRALLRHSKVLVLDEATAAVDMKTENVIQKTIREAFRECTVLTIAHRLQTIIDSDRILVMQAGEIAEFDSPKNLLANEDSIFSGMVRQLGPEQEALMKRIANGEVSYVATLEEKAKAAELQKEDNDEKKTVVTESESPADADEDDDIDAVHVEMD
jgi:ABC-type multidrug transport system fused ATPase/permease subunit